MKNNLVSVIIPVYNGEKYIKNCLENVLSQTYKNLEIIVVDDGSTDRSAEIAAGYPVKIVAHERNSGLSAARNTGIDNAQGDYIHFMDVDDLLNTDFYKSMVEAIVSTGSDIACSGVIHGQARYKTQLFRKQRVYTSTKDKLTATYVGKWGYVWRYLYRLDFLRKHNMRFEVGRFVEDLSFSLPSLYFAEKIVTVPGAEYLYVFVQNSIINNPDKAHHAKVKADAKHAQKIILDFARSHGFRIPGLNTGVWRYILRKVWVKIFRNNITGFSEKYS